VLPKSRRPALRFAASGSLAIAILLGLFFAQPIERYFVKNYYFYFDHSDDLVKLFGSLENTEDVFRARSPYQRIDIVHDKVGYDTDMVIDAYSSKFVENPMQPRNYVLFLNGDYQLASSYEEYYHEFFAHVPIITNGATPRRVLVMGAGDGLLIRELIKYPDIESIVHVDLDRKLVELAETHPVLVAMNEGALGDPRIRTYFDDAYRYIRDTTESFDAIYLDFPLANDYNLSRLYSREFFHFVRQHLAPGGFVVLDAPGLKNRANRREIYTSTVKTAGFNYVRPYITKIEDFNREAMRILLRSGYGSAKSRRLLVEHAKSLRYGFVMARDNLPEKPLYRDPRVKLHVLTDERLLATLQNKIPPLPPLDPSKVNSIFRPTLPDGRIWQIRSAW
jgi:spermidine synthase